jgi:uncharacterized protein YndB with AHSA1/START domain
MDEHPRFSNTYTIPAPVEEVWSAITQPELISQWHLCEVAEFSPEVGGKVVFAANGEVVIQGTITVFEPFQQLGHTFMFTSEPYDPPTQVLFNLRPDGKGCSLRIDHTGFRNINNTYRDIYACWPILMCGLQAMLEQRSGDQTHAA